MSEVQSDADLVSSDWEDRYIFGEEAATSGTEGERQEAPEDERPAQRATRSRGDPEEAEGEDEDLPEVQFPVLRAAKRRVVPEADEGEPERPSKVNTARRGRKLGAYTGVTEAKMRLKEYQEEADQESGFLLDREELAAPRAEVRALKGALHPQPTPIPRSQAAFPA